MPGQIAKIAFVLILVFLTLDILKRGLSGIFHKEILIYKWHAFIGHEGGGPGRYKELDKRSSRWIWNDEKVTRGSQAVFFWAIYFLLGLIVLTATIYAIIFI